MSIALIAVLAERGFSQQQTAGLVAVALLPWLRPETVGALKTVAPITPVSSEIAEY